MNEAPQRRLSKEIDNLSIMFEKRELVLPRADLCPELIDEAEAFEFSITDSGNVRTGSPSGLHDDCVIGLALAAWQVRPSKPNLFWTVEPL